MANNNCFSDKITVFHNYTLPETNMHLAGYSALIYRYELAVPLPYTLCAISSKRNRYQEGKWTVHSNRLKPADTLIGHLTFALKHEHVDLLVLKKLFESVDPSEIKRIVDNKPTGRYSRRIWFFYEWLTGQNLDLTDAKTGNYVDALDSDQQYPGPVRKSKRHRVRNNLPGVRGFCPLIRRTEKLEQRCKEGLDKKVKEIVDDVHPDLIARAASFLLLKDSKASYAIEGETPPQRRAERWGKAIGQAGDRPLTPKELLRLQEVVIEDQRFVNMGWREEGGFVGVHNRVSGKPLPDHISARWQDISSLVEALTNTNDLLIESDYNSVLAATLIAFGFVFIHPLADGNGRIHRYLIHHVLARKGFTSNQLIFPVSAVILQQIDRYKEVLESFSTPRLSLIDWEATPDGNVEVLNDTHDLYRYFDATEQAEFLFDCVKETVLHSLPEEVQYLQRHDRMKSFIKEHFDMPDKDLENLIGFLRQGSGTLSNRARNNEFKALTNEEVSQLENKYRDIFNP